MNTLTTTPKALKAALAVPLKVTCRKSTRKIFQCVRLSWKAGKALIQATDLEWCVHADLAGEATGEGVAIVPVSELASLSKLKADAVRFTLDSDKLVAEWEGAKASAKRVMECEDPEQYPELPAGNGAGAHAFPELGKVLGEASRFAGQEAARFVLNGIKLDPSGIVTTDGRRLYRYCHKMHGGHAVVGVLPIKGKVLESIYAYAIADRFVTFLGCGFTLIGRVMDGNFPDFTQIIPTHCAITTDVDAGAWTEAIEAVEPSCSVESQAVVLELGRGELTVIAAGGDSSTEARIPLPRFEQVHRIGFNPSYLRDFLKLKPETFSMSNRNGAAIFNGGPRELVLMPVLID